MTRHFLITLLLPRREGGTPLRQIGPLALWSPHKQRRALSRLDPRLREDVGLDADQARTEAERPVWDVPDHWRR